MEKQELFLNVCEWRVGLLNRPREPCTLEQADVKGVSICSCSLSVDVRDHVDHVERSRADSTTMTDSGAFCIFSIAGGRDTDSRMIPAPFQ